MVEKQSYTVTLPLTEEDCNLLIKASSFWSSADSHNKAIRSIGTLVDSSVPVVARTSELDLACVRKGKPGDIYSHESWEGSDNPVFTVPLVRQSDHLAALAEKQAEVERLRGCLKKIATSKPFTDPTMQLRRWAMQTLAGATS